MDILIIIPVFNEAPTVKKLLKHISEITGNDEDLLIINDGSTDRISEILQQYKNITVVSHKENEGYGKSLIDGFNYAKNNNYEIVLTMDADYQHRPELIPVLEKEIKDVDIVSGSRYLKGIPQQAPRDRVSINREMTRLIVKHTHYKITDSFCGFKCYKVNSLRKLDLTEKGYGLPIQLWLQADKAGLRIKEFPVEPIYCDRRRNFKGQFENAQNRLNYYKEVFCRELKKIRG